MTGWRKLADELREDSNAGHDRHDSAPVADPLALARDWREAVASIDAARPQFGLERLRFRQLVEDAVWLLEHFARSAACDGWSALDLFGVMPGRNGWGGVADRLRGSRSLVMSGEVARWRRVVNGEPESFARGLGDTVQMVPLWEIAPPSV